MSLRNVLNTPMDETQKAAQPTSKTVGRTVDNGAAKGAAVDKEQAVKEQPSSRSQHHSGTSLNQPEACPGAKECMAPAGNMSARLAQDNAQQERAKASNAASSVLKYPQHPQRLMPSYGSPITGILDEQIADTEASLSLSAALTDSFQSNALPPRPALRHLSTATKLLQSPSPKFPRPTC